KTRVSGVAKSLDIVKTRHAAGCSHVDIRSSSDSKGLLDVWSTEHTITSDVRVDDTFHTAFSHRSGKFDCEQGRCGFPTSRHHAAIARIDPDADSRSKVVDEVFQ